MSPAASIDPITTKGRTAHFSSSFSALGKYTAKAAAKPKKLKKKKINPKIIKKLDIKK
ncbi:hypothetical protein [Acinetobacter sp. CWB-B33]|uniref:hypothetical protein n=1 Tax=Acinetobacter sp. CWB-B33 TaxID=2815724 RepID=UPI0031FEAE35